MKDRKTLRVKLFADGADKAGMLEMCRHPLIKGFTTNPTLMRKAGITDFRALSNESQANWFWRTSPTESRLPSGGPPS